MSLKYRVQKLIDAKLLNFSEKPNIGTNPLPGHGSSNVNAISENSERYLIRKVEEVKTPLRVIFAEMIKRGIINGNLDERQICGLHPGADHPIEKCSEFKQILQDLMDCRLVQVGKSEAEHEVAMNDGQIPIFPKPLVVHYTKSVITSILNDLKPITVQVPTMLERKETSQGHEELFVGSSLTAPTPTDLKPIVIQLPAPFPFKDTTAIPWNYNAKIIGGSPPKEPSSETSSVTNIVGVGGMTRSGRIYTPEELGKKHATEPEKCEKGKSKKDEGIIEEMIREKEPRKTVSDEEASEFLKFVKQSEYMVVDQLNRLPAKISLLALLMNSEPHRQALIKVLNEAYVIHNISVDKFEGIVGNITANNYLTFTDDEIPVEGAGHNRALYISVKCKQYIMAKVLVDNGSSLNVIPKSTLVKLPFDASYMRPSNTIVRAFDGTRREVMGEIDLPIQIGPTTFQVNFQVMDITPAYSCLLGRPWIHAARAVPSTLHQKIKFVINDKLVVVSAEEDLLVSKPLSTPYIEAAEEALETSFQALEIVNATYVGEEMPVIKAHPSDASLMVAKVMLEGGYQHGRGLGKYGQGITEFPMLIGNKDRYGLGYKPTKADKMRITMEKKERRLARLENRESRTEGVSICDLLEIFQSAGFEFLSPVAVAEEDVPEGQYIDLIHLCAPDLELSNWEAVELPMVYKSVPK